MRAQASASLVDAGLSQPLDPSRSLVLIAAGKGGQRIVALNRAALEGGLSLGELLSNARSKLLDLQVCDADPAADAHALRQLALWAMQYSPLVAAWDEASGADGLFLDITGVAHLFGGEERLLAELYQRLRSFDLYPRLAVAGTPGAAWALAHHGKRHKMIVASGSERAALENLPLAALRLPPEVLTALRRLGFRRIGELIEQPRAPFAARFDVGLLARLDQALGRAPEPLLPVIPPPVYRAQAQFLEPILAQEEVLEAATRLLQSLMPDLARARVGARLLRLLLFKMDGRALVLDLGLAAPSRDAQHIAQLIGLRLHRLHCELETDFGFEAAAVHVLIAEALPERQHQLAITTQDAAPEDLALLVDRLQQRLGPGAVRQLIPFESHIPERAVRKSKGFALPPATASAGNSAANARKAGVRSPLRDKRDRHPNLAAAGAAAVPLLDVAGGAECAKEMPFAQWATAEPTAARPLMLLPRPEPADVIAVVPEGPPRQFRWRGIPHQVAFAGGPERIAPEWWRRTEATTRDYYVVEDTGGRRFWLFRAGLYERETNTPKWFVHGVFA